MTATKAPQGERNKLPGMQAMANESNEPAKQPQFCHASFGLQLLLRSVAQLSCSRPTAVARDGDFSHSSSD
jgi:hypothetical protein